MINARWTGMLLAGALVALAAGCGKPNSEMAAADMKGPPPRPAELDRLNDWAGNWDYSMEMTMYEGGKPKTMSGKGTTTAAWDVDRRLMVERVSGEIPDMPPFQGMSVTTWDPHDKAYRMWWFDNMGSIESGEMKYDEATKTWNSKGRGRDGMTGDSTSGKGHMKMLDANTIEWQGTQWDSWGITKKMDMKGTSKRRM